MKKIALLITIILLTHTAKAQWQIIDSITGANYINIHFWDANHGIISGEAQGRFFKTSNGGVTWDTIVAPVLTSIVDYRTDMQFVDDKIGFVCGGSGFSTVQTFLIGTKDGGLTWDSLVYNVPGGIEFSGLDFKYEDAEIHGIVFGYYFMYKSLDTGRTLTAVNLPSSIFRVNDAILANGKIILSGKESSSTANKIYTSTNWGATWNTVYTDTIAAVSLGVHGNTVIAGSGYGYIFRSTDAGSTWTKIKVGSDSEGFRMVKFSANGDAYLLGQLSIYGSGNDGITWHGKQVDTAYFWLWDMSMPTRDTGYVIANRRLYKTTNGGGMSVSVNNISPVNDLIRVYPNPAVQQVYIDVPANVKVNNATLYDATGRSVMKWQKTINTIDVTSLVKGVYILELQTDKYTSRKQLVIK